MSRLQQRSRHVVALLQTVVAKLTAGFATQLAGHTPLVSTLAHVAEKKPANKDKPRRGGNKQKKAECISSPTVHRLPSSMLKRVGTGQCCVEAQAKKGKMRRRRGSIILPQLLIAENSFFPTLPSKTINVFFCPQRQPKRWGKKGQTQISNL